MQVYKGYSNGNSTDPSISALDYSDWKQPSQSLWVEHVKQMKKKEKEWTMSFSLKPVAKRIVKVLRSNTTKGKVDELEDLSKSLTENTKLVAEKYEELKTVEGNIKKDLVEITGQKFVKEMAEIDGMDLMPEVERESFKKALLVVRDKSIEDLKPIGETAQRVKAHMLVTMHKALQQKILLVAKSKLAGNATLQLETLKVIQKQTKDINVDLAQLLAELDELNRDALNKHQAFEKNVEDRTEEGVSAVDSIVNRIETMENREKITK